MACRSCHAARGARLAWGRGDRGVRPPSHNAERGGGIDALCRLVLLGMLPALAETDLESFGDCLYDFDARAGKAFAEVQGGVYSGPLVAECVAFLRSQGVHGVGQSSWGPTVFAVVGDEDRAADLLRRLAPPLRFRHIRGMDYRRVQHGFAENRLIWLRRGAYISGLHDPDDNESRGGGDHSRGRRPA